MPTERTQRDSGLVRLLRPDLSGSERRYAHLFFQSLTYPSDTHHHEHQNQTISIITQISVLKKKKKTITTPKIWLFTSRVSLSRGNNSPGSAGRGGSSLAKPAISRKMPKKLRSDCSPNMSRPTSTCDSLAAARLYYLARSSAVPSSARCHSTRLRVLGTLRGGREGCTPPVEGEM